jgi:NAD(P)-dependent dehydrogenase (short-subunit alcohol dehydrogenase family)
LVGRTISELGRFDTLVNYAAYQMTREGIEAIPDGSGSTPSKPTSSRCITPARRLGSTKWAIVTFSKALAQEGAEKGIRVNVVAPGPVWTPLIPATLPEEKAQHIGQDSLLGRPAQPAELARFSSSSPRTSRATSRARSSA